MLFNKPATPTPTPAPHPARLAMLDAERARVIAAYRWERGKSEGIAGVIFELETYIYRSTVYIFPPFFLSLFSVSLSLSLCLCLAYSHFPYSSFFFSFLLHVL